MSNRRKTWNDRTVQMETNGRKVLQTEDDKTTPQQYRKAWKQNKKAQKRREAARKRLIRTLIEAKENEQYGS